MSVAALVLGSAVRYGDWLPEVLTFMRTHALASKQRLLALFAAGNKAKDSSDAALAETAACMRATREIAEPTAHRSFAGKIDFKTLLFFEKMVPKMIGSPEGDFGDWAAIARGRARWRPCSNRWLDPLAVSCVRQ